MSSSSKAGSSSAIDAEIARLMRDPDALRSERQGMQRPGGRGHYDPNQPRVPAGDPKGGQFASKGYRGGDSGRDAAMMRAPRGGTQFAELAREDQETQDFGHLTDSSATSAPRIMTPPAKPFFEPRPTSSYANEAIGSWPAPGGRATGSDSYSLRLEEPHPGRIPRARNAACK